MSASEQHRCAESGKRDRSLEAVKASPLDMPAAPSRPGSDVPPEGRSDTDPSARERIALRGETLQENQARASCRRSIECERTPRATARLRGGAGENQGFERGGEFGRKNRLFTVAFVALLVGLVLVERFEFLAEVNRAMGIVLVLLGAIAMRTSQRRWAPELTLALAFIAWAALSGWIVADYPDEVTAYVRTLIQTIALSAAVFIVTFRRGTPGFVFVGLFVCCLGLLGGLLLLGELAEVRAVRAYRVRSLAANPNFVGIICLYALMSVAWLWYRFRRSLSVRAILLASLPPIAYLLVLTGSRKAFLATLLFGVSWLLFTGVRLFAGRASSLVLAGLAVGVVILNVLPGSTLEARLNRAARNPDLETTRKRLYVAAIDLFVASPVTGVGLGNFITAAGMGLYAHSEYAEILATTGAVGGGLYFSIYVLMIRRLARVRRVSRDPHARYYVGLYSSIILTTLALGTGVPNFLSPWHWTLMLGIVGHACAMEYRSGQISMPPGSVDLGAGRSQGRRV